MNKVMRNKVMRMWTEIRASSQRNGLAHVRARLRYWTGSVQVIHLCSGAVAGTFWHVGADHGSSFEAGVIVTISVWVLGRTRDK